MEYDLIELIQAVNNIDISYINEEYFIEVIEKTGTWKRWRGNDLSDLIHKVHFEYLG